MNKRTLILLIIVVVGILIVSRVFFVVDVMEHAVVTMFGKPVQVYVDQPGLKVRIPPIQKVRKFDNRLRVYQSMDSEFLTVDKTNIMVTFYALWRIDDPLKYLISVRDRISAESKLDKIISSRLGSAFGQIPFTQLIDVDPEIMRLGEILDEVLAQCREEAKEDYGIELADLRLRRLAFPEQVRESVLNRIRSERRAKSREIRSEGEADATRIRAEAEAARAKILAEARRQATVRVGKGEAEAARIWREALEENLDFYDFQKRLEVLEKTIDGDTSLFIPSDSPLMELLLQGADEKGLGAGDSVKMNVE